MKKLIIILSALALIGAAIIALRTTYCSEKNAQQFAQKLLTHAGITINGTQPWDIQVHNEKLYQRVIAEGSLGLGESYMEGWWDCPPSRSILF